LSERADTDMGSEEKELNYVRNATIKAVTEDSERFQFNTSIARLMELVNELYKYDSSGVKNTRLYKDTILDLLKLMAPFAPHLAEELWDKMGMPYSIFNEQWPVWDGKALVRDEIEIAIQINGKIKEKIMIPSGLDKAQTEEAVMQNENVKALLEGVTVLKVIAVPGRLVNIVVK
jgi:leucyl-tRNA synthetase